MFEFLDQGKKDVYGLSYQGIECNESYAYFSNFRKNEKPTISVSNELMRKKLQKLSLRELFLHSSEISFYLDKHTIFPMTMRLFPEDGVLFQNRALFELAIEAEDWKELYSVRDFSDCLKETTEQIEFEDLGFYREDDDFVTNGIGFLCDTSDIDKTVEEYLNTLIPQINHVIQKTKVYLYQKTDSVVIELELPNEIKAPCEQYLMYFSQFLSDLGISVSNEINHFGKKTIFSVIPENKEQALSVISDALASYLSLPVELDKQNILNAQKDIALMQLEANVMHFKSQLMLAQSVLEAKNATIQSLSLTNEQYRNMNVIQSESPSSKTNEESLIGEVVKVKEYQGKLISVDLPRILKNLKRMVRK